jgi:hypothetical protein
MLFFYNGPLWLSAFCRTDRLTGFTGLSSRKLQDQIIKTGFRRYRVRDRSSLLCVLQKAKKLVAE